MTGIVFGLAPAIQASRSDLASVLKVGNLLFGPGCGGPRLHNLLVIAQMALSMTLLIGAALLFRSMQAAHNVDHGFEKRNLMLLSTDLDLRGYTADEGRRFYRRLLDRMQFPPELRYVSLTNLFTLSLAWSEAAVTLEGRESQSGNAQMVVGMSNVSPGYFETMGIPLIQGRSFNYHDIAFFIEELAILLFIEQSRIAQRFADRSP